MNTIAFHCSSFVAQQCGYHPHNQWADCVRASSEYYRPLETFAARFELLILTVRALDYDALDVWQAGQLDWRWATPDHIDLARDLLTKHNLTLTSYAGEFGVTRQEFLDACAVARGIRAAILSGTTRLLFNERAFVIETLHTFDLKLAIENHPETSAQEMLDQIGDGGAGRIGTAVDTGWYATRGYAVPRAIHELGAHILHVHLKDVLAGAEHINCGYGKGIVPLEASVRALRAIGYQGVISVEEHTLDHDPTSELQAALPLVRAWLA